MVKANTGRERQARRDAPSRLPVSVSGSFRVELETIFARRGIIFFFQRAEKFARIFKGEIVGLVEINSAAESDLQFRRDCGSRFFLDADLRIA